MNFKQGYHLSTQYDWINDPNGLCFYNGEYHIFYQAAHNKSPKFWGHYSSKDLINFKDYNAAVKPTIYYEKDGVYSGSALVVNNKIKLIYSGNLKLEGEHDYIHSGRIEKVLTTESEDGINFKNKHELNLIFPENYSNHIRDPKVFRYNDSFYLVISARDKNDTGCALLYQSENLEDFNFVKRYDGDDPGYMWECADIVHLDDGYYLIISKQKKEKCSVGYYFLGKDILECGKLHDFKILDYGPDFYASQTFAETDNNIQLSWMGMCDDLNEFPAGAKQCLTTFRRIYSKNGHICQMPVIEQLYTEKIRIKTSEYLLKVLKFAAEFKIDADFNINIRAVELNYKNSVLNISIKEGGFNRKDISINIDNINEILAVSDESSIEIFINKGEYAYTSRIFNNVSMIQMDKEYEMKITYLKNIEMRNNI